MTILVVTLVAVVLWYAYRTAYALLAFLTAILQSLHHIEQLLTHTHPEE